MPRSLASSVAHLPFMVAVALLQSGWSTDQGSAAESQSQPELQHRSEAVVRYDSRQSLGRGVTKATLSNGMVVLIQENHAAQVATVRSFVKNTEIGRAHV